MEVRLLMLVFLRCRCRCRCRYRSLCFCSCLCECVCLRVCACEYECVCVCIPLRKTSRIHVWGLQYIFTAHYIGRVWYSMVEESRVEYGTFANVYVHVDVILRTTMQNVEDPCLGLVRTMEVALYFEHIYSRCSLNQ